MELRSVSPDSRQHSAPVTQAGAADDQPSCSGGTAVSASPTVGLRADGHGQTGEASSISSLADSLRQVSLDSSQTNVTPAKDTFAKPISDSELVLYVNPQGAAGYTRVELECCCLPNIIKLLEQPGNPRFRGEMALFELQRGTRAIVYKLSAIRKADVALKVQTQVGKDYKKASEFIECMNECRLLEQLQHIPGIIGLYSYGVFNGRCWMMLELGRQDWYSRQEKRGWQCSKGEMLRMACPLLEAVSQLHQRGIIHRDIKQENIIDCDGQPRLADFGAAVYADKGSVYELYRGIGTAEFKPPETLSYELGGSPGALLHWSEKADTWALGRVFLESLGVADDRLCLASWHPDEERFEVLSLKQLHTAYGQQQVSGRSVANWVSGLTGRRYEEYMNQTIPVPAADFRDSGLWRVHMILMALACHRGNPDHRPSIREMQQWFAKGIPPAVTR